MDIENTQEGKQVDANRDERALNSDVDSGTIFEEIGLREEEKDECRV
jgi:hypothetical protein